MERFPDAILERLAEVREIELETLGRRTGLKRGATVWVVVDEAVPYVRSEFGDAGHWYRNALEDRRVGLVIDGRRHEAIAISVMDPAIWGRVSDAYRAKYRRSRSLDVMVRREVEPMTLALDAGPARPGSDPLTGTPRQSSLDLVP